MPHEIDQTAGRPAVFTVGTPPWHGLGKTVAEAVNSRDAIGLAGLDWMVEQWPVSAVGPEGQTSRTGRFVANVRSDTQAVLGVVGAKYRPFQNQEAFAFADAIVGEGMAKYETAGALRGGRRVWMLLRLPDELKVGTGDSLRPYLLLFNSHDASSPLRAVLTTVRVVCQNTLNLAMDRARSEGVTIRHRGELQSQIIQARETLGLAHRQLKTLGDQIFAMKAVPMTRGRLDRYFNGLLPDLPQQPTNREKKNREAAIQKLHVNFTDPTNTVGGMRGTLWAALNAATEYADHQRRFRGESPAAKAESRLDSIWFGSANDFKQSAYRLAIEMAGRN